jgi:hypothetical protein
MSRPKLGLVGVLLFSAAVGVGPLKGPQSAPGAVQPADGADNAFSDEDWGLQPLHPLSLNLEWLPEAAPGIGALGGAYGRESERRPLSSLKLFNGGGISAEWRYGGPIRYTFTGIRPFGASMGSRLSSNSVRVTLTWSNPN